jgi:hypothetical protein
MFYVLGFGATVFSSIFLMSILEIDYHVTAMLWTTLVPTLVGLYLFSPLSFRCSLRNGIFI